jgi:hypothetical protein
MLLERCDQGVAHRFNAVIGVVESVVSGERIEQLTELALASSPARARRAPISESTTNDSLWRGVSSLHSLDLVRDRARNDFDPGSRQMIDVVREHRR